jgi:hypothetical protein
MNIPDGNDSWAQVELYRWQYGELPPQDETCKKLDVCVGLNAMADAIEKHDVKNFPSPVGVMTVLRYAAKLIRSKNENK